MHRQIKGKTASDIIEAAWREFAAGGFHGTRIDQIANAARSNKRMIYHYFENKEGLYKHLCESVRRNFSGKPDARKIMSWALLEAEPQIRDMFEAIVNERANEIGVDSDYEKTAVDLQKDIACLQICSQLLLSFGIDIGELVTRLIEIVKTKTPTGAVVTEKPRIKLKARALER